MNRTIALVLAVAAAAQAHHNLEQFYDVTRDVKVEGVVLQFLYRNPHSFVHIETSNGKIALEWSSTHALKKDGVTPESLRVGERGDGLDASVDQGRPKARRAKHDK